MEKAPLRPEMLVLGREEIGETQKSLAEKLGITQGTLSKLEAGLMAPTLELEQNLGKALNRPVSFFRYQGPIEAPTFVQYRKRVSIPAQVQRRFWALITLATIRIRQVLTSTEIDTPGLPSVDPHEMTGGPAEIARLLRRYWKVPPGPIKKVVQLIENAGVLVWVMDFGTRKIDACSMFVGSTPVIFVNSSLSAVRQRTTIIHELGHLIMHRNTLPDAEREQEAFQFAAEFLTPALEIESSFRPLSMDRLARLKLYWGVSMQALVKRAEAMGAISRSTARYYWAKMSREGMKECEPYDDKLKSEQPTLLTEILSTYRTELGFTDAELAEHLLVAVDELKAIELRSELQFKIVK
jgi:Zn-dependent peptidase ImmA (M78 family)/transcriptional regulator with XRE-family HTH domain